MKPYHFQKSKLSKLMTYDEYLEFNVLYKASQRTPENIRIELNKSTHATSNSKQAMSIILGKLIVLHAKLMGHELIRMNNTGTPIINKLTKQVTGWRPSASGKGRVTDITGNCWGEKLEIEIKYGNDRLSESQQNHIDKALSRGGLIFVIKSFSDYINQVSWLYDKEKFKAWKIEQMDRY